jgi:hypothetical protein
MMRKGKMAAKMAEMRRAAELEANTDEYNDDVDGGGYGLQSLSVGNTTAADSDRGDADISSLQLEYVSTMHMKPLRDMAQKAEEVKKSAEQEMERIRQVEAANPTLPNWRSDSGSDGRSNILKAPLMRMELGVGAMRLIATPTTKNSSQH